MEYRNKLRELGITLDKTGSQICPKCSPTRQKKHDKCLSVKYDNEAVLYNCHHCDFSGAVFYRDKFENKKHYKRPLEPKQNDNKENLYKYFEKRNISREVLDLYKIGINDKKEIIFRYYKNGELANVKYRTNLGDGKKTFRQETDAEKTLFGMDVITDFDIPLIWVEGEMDVLSFAEFGCFAVSVPQGAGENKLECIDNCWEWIQKFQTHIIAVDNDEPGDKLKANLLQRLGKNNCKIVNFKQYKDANEMLCEGGDLKKLIDDSEFVNPDGVVSFNDCVDEILDFYNNGYTKGYSTGWESLDRKFTIKTGYLMIVTGYPSRGKSFFADNLIFNLTKQYGFKHLVASFENTNANHFARFAQMYTNKKFNMIPETDLQGIFDEVSSHFYRLRIDKMWSIDEICEAAELAVRKYGIKTLTIDPYNRLNNSYTDREDKYIGSILGKLCMLAKKLDILIIFIAHPKKPDGEKMPTLYSISGSADWYNMADYGIIVHRERNPRSNELFNRPKICVAKVKDFNLGDPSGGEVELIYRPDKFILTETRDD